MEIPSEFFTLQSMLTLSGATGATFVIANGCQAAFNFNPRWLALFIAIIISLFGVFETSAASLSDIFVGIVNGFLIFCTTVGATGAIGTPDTTDALARGSEEIVHGASRSGKRTFLTRWY